MGDAFGHSHLLTDWATLCTLRTVPPVIKAKTLLVARVAALCGIPFGSIVIEACCGRALGDVSNNVADYTGLLDANRVLGLITPRG